MSLTDCESLNFISDIRKLEDTDLYKLFKDDIEFMQYLFTIDENQNSFEQEEKDEIKSTFLSYLTKKGREYYNWLNFFLIIM